MVPNTMWPMLLDLSQDDCKRILRKLELEAYSGIISALRAQGTLSKDKRKLLQDLSSVLHISIERHKAEIRRAVNDEKLATIAELMAGPNTNIEWAIEGRRLIPLMPRLVPQTNFTTLASKMADFSAAENANWLPPFDTVRQREYGGASVDESPQDILSNSVHLGSSSDVQVAWSSPLQDTGDTDNEVEEIEIKQPVHVGVKRRRVQSPSRDRCMGPPELKGQTMSSPVSRGKLSPVPCLLQDEAHRLHYFHHEQNEQQLEDYQPSSPLPSLPPQTPPPPPPPLQIATTIPPPPLQIATTMRTLPPASLLSSLPAPPPLKQKPSMATYQASKQTQLRGANVSYDTVREGEQIQQSHLPPQFQKSHLTLIPRLVMSPKQLQTLPQSHISQSAVESSSSPPHLRPPQITSSPKIQEVASPSSISGQPSQATSHTRVVSGGSPSSTPVKITFTSTSGRSPLGNIGASTTTTLTSTSAPTTQKVIIVQSSGTTGSPGPPSILQRSLSVPVGKTTPVTGSSRTPFIISGPGSSPPLTPTTIVTISTNPANTNNLTTTTVSIDGVPTTAYITSPGSGPRLRPKTMQLPCRLRPRSGSIVIPVTPNPILGTSGVPGMTLKTTSLQGSWPGSHVRPETSGMKIYPMAGGPIAGAMILPKPVYGSSSQTPVYMVNTTTSGISMVTRTVSVTDCRASYAGSTPSPRMLSGNATSRPLSASAPQTRPATPTLVTKTACASKTTCTATSGAVSSRATATPKKNIIMVRKAPRQISFQGSHVHNIPVSMQEMFNRTVTNKSLSTSGSPSTTSCTTTTTSLPVALTHSAVKAQQQAMCQASNVLVLDISHEDASKNMVLADILQASGITAETEMLYSEDKEEVEQTVTISTAAHHTSEDPGFSAAKMSRNKSTTFHVTRAGDLMEVAGELDPQTGVYSLHAEETPDSIIKGPSVTIVPGSSFEGVDAFGSTFATAGIDLDSFQYEQEGLGEEVHGIHGESQHSSSVEVTIGTGVDEDIEQQLHFLQGTGNGPDEPVAVTVEPSHIDTTGMHIEDYTSQKLQEQTD